MRANWEMIFLVWLRTVLMLALSSAALLPLFLVLDLDPLPLTATLDEGAGWFFDAFVRVEDQLYAPAFWLAVLSSSATLTAVLLCYSFVQAGVFGVLSTADRQAPHSRLTESTWFRTFSWVEFQGRGGRHMWRFFWLFNLVCVVWLGWALLAVLALAATGVVAGSAGPAAGLAMGCAAVFPLGFLCFVSFFWSLCAQAAIADDDCGVREAAMVGLRFVVRRLGAVTLLFLVMLVPFVSMAMVFLVLSVSLSAGLVSSGGLQLAATAVLQAAQWLVTGVIQLTLSGAIVAIWRGEKALEAGDSALAAP